MLKNQQKYQQAAAVFKLQIEWYPKSSNAYDSYAEVNDLLGHKAVALANYKRSLALDTTNTNARYRISALENRRHFTAKQLKVFEGKFYKNGKKEEMHIELKTKGNELVLTQSWDGNSLKFFRVAELEFYNSAVGFLLKFAKDKDGKIVMAYVNTMLPWVKLTGQL